VVPGLAVECVMVHHLKSLPGSLPRMRPGVHIDLVELELLVAVSETGSLGRAGSRLGMSQPAVSMRMKGLESVLGVKVLMRDSSGTKVTPAGAAIVTAAREVLDATSRLVALSEHFRLESASRLHIAASFTVAEHLAPMWIEALLGWNPEASLSLDVVNSSRVLSLVQHLVADLGFVEGPSVELPGVESMPVMTDSLVVVVAPSHPYASLDHPFTGEDLAATEMIVREQGSGTRDVLEEALTPFGGVRTRLEFGSSAAILAAARRGEGPAVVSQLVAWSDLISGALKLVPTTGIDLGRTIRAVWSESAELSELAKKFLAVAVDFGENQRGHADRLHP